MEIVTLALGVYLVGVIITYTIRGEPHRIRKALGWPATALGIILTIIGFAIGIPLMGFGLIFSVSSFPPLTWVGVGMILVGILGALCFFTILKPLLWVTADDNGG